MKTKQRRTSLCKCGHWIENHYHEFYGKGKRGKNVNDWVCNLCGCEDFKKLRKNIVKILWYQRHDLWHWYKIFRSIKHAIRATFENTCGYCCYYDFTMNEIAEELNLYRKIGIPSVKYIDD